MALFVPKTIGDAHATSSNSENCCGGRVQKLSAKRRSKPTRAEAKLESILNEVNNGALQGRFRREWAFAGKWILDFFFHENRLGIEVDGSYHSSEIQQARDLRKAKDCERFDVTLIRISNEEVFGSREALIEKLRAGYREANKRMQELSAARPSKRGSSGSGA